VLLAYRCAFGSPRVTATAIEANEFPQLAQEMQVWAVPRIVVDGEPRWDGAVPEPEFLRRVLSS
jgi:predicted thioredoxin/glutaredoxin